MTQGLSWIRGRLARCGKEPLLLAPGLRQIVFDLHRAVIRTNVRSWRQIGPVMGGPPTPGARDGRWRAGPTWRAVTDWLLAITEAELPLARFQWVKESR